MPPMSIARRQQLRPQGRNWQQVAEMLISHIEERPLLLICRSCLSDHICIDPNLKVHCSCGTTTQFSLFSVFHAWCSVTWGIAIRAHHGNVVDCSNPIREMYNASARVFALEARGQEPMDVRVHIWRRRMR